MEPIPEHKTVLGRLLLTTPGERDVDLRDQYKDESFSAMFYVLLSVMSHYRQAGHQELADRLVEIQFELTDRLAFYLCGRKPGQSSVSL